MKKFSLNELRNIIKLIILEEITEYKLETIIDGYNSDRLAVMFRPNHDNLNTIIKKQIEKLKDNDSFENANSIRLRLVDDNNNVYKTYPIK